MAVRLVNIDRKTPLLLPPDLRDWVPDDHIVHFILEAVDGLDLQGFRVNERGTGDEQYPPAMLLGLLVYCYATGRFSSRGIEQATYSDVAVRYLCGNTHPDHDTICTFRRVNGALFKECFVKVLGLASELGHLRRVGGISVDGTKIQANASKHAAVSYERAGAMIGQLELEVGELMHKAEDADSTPLDDGLSIPAEIARREVRQAKLAQARQLIEERYAELKARKQAEYERKLAARKAERRSGRKPRGPDPQPPPPAPPGKSQHNFTDPESRIMKAGNGDHFEQAYNAQAAVDVEGSLLIMGNRVSPEANDKQELPATVNSVPGAAREVNEVLADSGFFSEKAVREVEAGHGPSVLAAVGKTPHRCRLADLERRPEPHPPPEPATITAKMRHRLQTRYGKERYKLRKQTVEPVFGIIKEVLGFRRFRLRGLEKVSLEWQLVCLAWNFKRLFKLATARPLTAAAH